MPPAERRRERFPAALQGKGKEPADDNDSRITASAAAVADTDLLADADAAAGSRDSEEMVERCLMASKVCVLCMQVHVCVHMRI